MLKAIAKYILKTIGLSLLITGAATTANAQEFGGNPPSVKWKQVNTPAAKVIFPAGMDSAGLRVANIVQRINGALQPTIGYKQRQVSILLQNQTIISNAYVGLAPFRSEFYLTPDQNSFELGSLPWADQLAIHEFRHVQQYNNFNVGLSKALRILFGEGGQALGNDIAIPNWFFEGDAVYNETLVSRQGRGRLPYFYNGYRSLWAAGRGYSWMKLRNGSLVDYVPDHYPLGYMLVAYGREKYGDQFWKNVTHDAASFDGLFYPFRKAVKKYSEVNYTVFRNDALNQFKMQFDDHSITNQAHFIADQEYPAYINDSTLIYIKSTYNHLPQFVIKTGDKERTIAVRDISIDTHFSYQNGKLVYAAYRPDLRWGYRDYNELVVLDINSGKEHRLTRKTKYFSPAFSADGKTIVAVQVDIAGKSQLHLLDAESGKLIKSLPNPKHYFYTYPQFYDKENLIVAVRDTAGAMGFALTNIKTGAICYTGNFSMDPIGFIQVHDDSVFFTKTSGLKDRLFVLIGPKFQLHEVQDATHDASIGYYQPAVSATKIAWVEPTAFGYSLKEVDRNNIQLPEIKGYVYNYLPDMGIKALSTDSSANLLASVGAVPLAVTKYNKAHGLFNFHSLIPDFNDPNYTLSLEGENVLNTFQSQLLFNYNRNEGYKQFGFNAIYGALFPYISGGVDYTLDRRGFSKGKNVYWNESDIHTGFEIPLNFTAGKQITGLTFGSDIYYKRTLFQQPYQSQFTDRNYTYLNNYISFTTHIQQAKQHIYPRFGQTISMNYKTAMAGLNASQFLASGTFYFPGILMNHNLVINAAHQQKGTDNGVDFSNNFPFARGYTAENLHNMNKIGVNYHFPIVYPDAGIANTIYFLRIRGNVFYDYTHATDFYTSGATFKGDFRSTGGELFFDTKWFNQQPLTFGIRYSRLLDNDLFGGTGRNRIEIVLPVSFF